MLLHTETHKTKEENHLKAIASDRTLSECMRSVKKYDKLSIQI